MYKNVWLALVDLQAKEGKKFNDLIDLEDNDTQNYHGAWGNILIITDKINKVSDIIEAGLNELDMTVKFINKIENVSFLAEYEEIHEDVLKEAAWLLSSDYIFKISDKLFPYSE